MIDLGLEDQIEEWGFCLKLFVVLFNIFNVHTIIKCEENFLCFGLVVVHQRLFSVLAFYLFC